MVGGTTRQSILHDRQKSIKHYDAYYEGKHPLSFATAKYREAFGNLFSAFADNWCDLVIDATKERLHVQGIRVPNGDNANDNTGDKDAWRIWQANNLDADSNIAHAESLINGICYAIVAPGKDENTPSISIESPHQVIVALASGSRRERLAALKRWHDDEGYDRATLYLPDWIYRFRSVRRSDYEYYSTTASSLSAGIKWEPFAGDGVAEGENPLGVVPVVPISNRRRLLSEGMSELRKGNPATGHG